MGAQNVPYKSDETPSETMLRLISGYRISRALYVMVKLGIPDLLKDTARDAADLAQATQMHAPSLYRVLSVLVSIGALTKDDQSRFALTALGATLRSDVRGSLRAWALNLFDEDQYRAWGDVLHSVQTGEPAFNHLFGMDVWQYRALHPEQSKTFDEAMANLGSVANQAIVESYDFSAVRQVVDVGGGNGSLLIFLLNANPAMKGVVFDAPHVVEGAKKRIAAAGLAERCTTVGGNFFDSVPEGGDTCILSRIIHDWDDAHSSTILNNCRRAMPVNGRLLLSERVLPTQIEASARHQDLLLSDLNMLVMVGGRERTEAEYRVLLEAAHFRLTRVIPTRSMMSVIEAVAVAPR